MATIRKPGQGHAAPPSATTGELLNQRKIPRQIDYPVPPKPGPGPIQSAPGAREPVPPVNKPGGLPGTTTRVNVSAMGAAKKAQ